MGLFRRRKKRRHRSPASPEQIAALTRLRKRIERLGGDDARPIVGIDLFFDGNDDDASIAPNLGDDHPGMAEFASVLRSIEARDDVAAVLLQVDETYPAGEDPAPGDEYPHEWPYVQSVYVITTASGADVHEWAARLSPDPWDERDEEGWPDRRPPAGAPAVPAGHRVVQLFWD